MAESKKTALGCSMMLGSAIAIGMVVASAGKGPAVIPQQVSPSTSELVSEPVPSAARSLEPISMKRQSPVEIDEDAAAPYAADEYPKVVAKFGSALPEIDAARRKAAKIAAMDPRCDRVLVAQVTSRSTRSNRRYYAECENVTRLFFDDRSLADDRAAATQTVEDMTKDGLMDW